MADATITKRAMAEALKALMRESSFDKITITQICTRCNMSRKSFYYHFKDKYDLINWIFDTEIMDLIQKEMLYTKNNANLHPDITMHNYYSLLPELEDYHAGLQVFCDYFYENCSFYRTALQIQGQNSFHDHFREFLHPVFKYRLETLFQRHQFAPVKKEYLEFYVETLTDTFINAIERWIQMKNCMPSDEFVAMLLTLIGNASFAIADELSSYYKV